MSRGLGKIQREILRQVKLANGVVWVDDLAWNIANCGREPDPYGDYSDPPRSVVVSVRRAVRRLAEQGLLQAGYRRMSVTFPGQHMVCWSNDIRPGYVLPLRSNRKESNT